MAQKLKIVPIPGTTRLNRLDENLGAVEVELSADDLAPIDAARPQVPVHGERLAEAALQMTGRWSR